VANHDICHTEGLHLLDGHLTCICSAALEVAVLRSDHGTICEFAKAGDNLERRRAEVHIALACVTSLNVCKKTVKLRSAIWVALPVATDNGPSCHGAYETVELYKMLFELNRT